VRGRLLPVLILVVVLGVLAVAWAVEDTVPVPVHETGTASEGCCCDGEIDGCTHDCENCPECSCDEGGECCCDGDTESCTGNCDDCDAEHSDEDDCGCGSHHEHHCGGCH